jgi:hypothetical protein
MPDVNELHRFYECNLPEYQRRDLVAVTAFFVGLIKGDKGHPLRAALKNWDRFRWFVVRDWQGGAEIAHKKLPPSIEAAPVDHGRCPCGGRMVKRVNRAKGNFFLGCSKYPKCKNTQTLDE